MKRYLSFLITADIHFEKLVMKNYENSMRYISETLSNLKPDIFIIAGDITDSKLIQVESKSYIELVKFIKELNELCLKNRIEFIILKGTPSHDGNVTKNIIALHELNSITFIDEPFYSINRNGYKLMFLPEVTYPKYDDFLKDLQKNSVERSDVIIFHNMFDFAIPALKQIDSEFNLGRSVVINSEDFNKYFNILSIGGHVHSFINNKDIYYTGQFINKDGKPGLPEEFGFKYIKLKDNEYQLKNIDNYYIHKVKTCDLYFTASIDSILDKAKNYNVKETLFKCYGIANDDFVIKFDIFKKTINPIYIKKVLKDNTDNQINDDVMKLGIKITSDDQLINMFKDIYYSIKREEVSNNLLDKLLEES